MKQRGFTLVEMLVALSIFAVIASIGVGLLRASVGTQGAVQDRLGAMSAVNRLRAIMANDLAQSVLRPARDERGNPLPAFRGDAQGFAFVHRGRVSDTGRRASAVQRVEYRLTDGLWQRRSAVHVDGAPLDGGDALLREVRGAAVRYRAADGAWRDGWSSETEGRLPLAVEVALTRGDRPPLILRFLTAPTLAPLPPPPEAQP